MFMYEQTVMRTKMDNIEIRNSFFPFIVKFFELFHKLDISLKAEEQATWFLEM